MTRTEIERNNQYRMVYRYATEENVKRTGLTGDIDIDETTLIERINTKIQKRDKYALQITKQYILDYYS